MRALALVLALAPGAIGAQALTGDATADSATVARSAWRRAGDALRGGDLATARREVTRAAEAWPTQEAYAWGRVALAARAADTATVIAGLAAYADLGIGRDLTAEPALAPFLAVPALAALAVRHDANRSSLGRGTVRATLPDSTFWPEGVDYDAKSGAYYVASVRHRTIAEVRAGRPPRELIPRHSDGIGAILGVRVDTARGVLWATTAGIPQMEGYAPADSGIAALLRIRITDGRIERRWDLPPSATGHTLGDLAVDGRGDVYVTDSKEPVLYRLPAGGDSLVPLRSPLFRSLQGIAPTPDGRALYVADWSHGILRVDLATGTVVRVKDAPGSVSLGCDGIAWDRGAIVAVQNGVMPARVMRFVLSADGLGFTRADVLDRNPAVADEPTIGAIVGDEFVYVANSQWEKYDAAGVRRAGKALTRPVLLAVPLPR
jgi:sugar lactone lactonase YvrE